MKLSPFLFLLLVFSGSAAQQHSTLSVEKIMQDPQWIGNSPTSAFWGYDSKHLYFDWNPENNESDSLYKISIGKYDPEKVPENIEKRLFKDGEYNKDRSLLTYSADGDIFLLELKSGKTTQITHTNDWEGNPRFSALGLAIIYTKDSDLYKWIKKDGSIKQLTDFIKSSKPKAGKKRLSKQNEWLKSDQRKLFEVLREREKKEENRKDNEPDEQRPTKIYIGDKTIMDIQLSPDERFITYNLMERSDDNSTAIVPNYVTLSGYTENLMTRTKVGSDLPDYEFYLFDRQTDSVIKLDIDQISGIYDLPEYLNDYPEKKDSLQKEHKARKVVIHGPIWSPNGKHAVVVARAQDNKDRWIMELEVPSGKLKLLDRQHDSAWVSGPGIGGWYSSGTIDWIDDQTIYFHSEESGYSHLYALNVATGDRKQLTSGNFEVQESQLSADKKTIYFVSNEVHPGEKQFYRISSNGGQRVQLTSLKGAHQVWLSPDEKYIAYRYSFSNKPWELYVQENKAGAKPIQITHSLSDEFKAYPWRVPEVITFENRYETKVYARLYKPKKSNGAAVVFVHGAGYLQNAHYWWSSYFREYMFHNLLTDEGYTVLDIDYQGSAGYGRDCRTAIYRHMGGKDLSDQVDGAQWLVTNLGIDESRIGVYGGSYGGFITLMALFTQPDVFAAGAALRSVTDWAHYNHGYTSNILNTPVMDPLAYKRSSPIYFAERLQKPLLICHGMVDVNVHFQDVVRLSQRLIELGKKDWEMAVYPVESHGFKEPSSWTDEYRRIHELFRQELLDKTTN